MYVLFSEGPPEAMEQIDRGNALPVDYHHRQVLTALACFWKGEHCCGFPQ